MKITDSHYCYLLIILSTKVHDYYFVSLYCHLNVDGVLCQRVFVTTATHIVTLNSSSFQGILKGKYDLASICVDAGKELYFIVHKSLSCDLKMSLSIWYEPCMLPTLYSNIYVGYFRVVTEYNYSTNMYTDIY